MRLGPGLLVTAAFIGPGTITTATMAGGNFGYNLLWALLFSVIATLTIQTMAARLGIVTGNGLAEAFRSQIEKPWLKWLTGALIIGAIGVGNSAYQTGNLAGAAIGASDMLELTSGNAVLLISITALIVLLSGKAALIERALVGLVAVMALLFVATMIALGPDLGALLKGLLVPTTPAGSLTTIIALIGTTVVPYNLFLHATLAAKRWHGVDKETAFKESFFDMLLAAIVGGLITMSIVVAAAIGLKDDVSVQSMGTLLSPLLGDYSPKVFGLGLLAAGLTSALAAPMAAAFAVGGMLGLDTDYKSKCFKVVTTIVVVFGASFAYFGSKPLTMILFAQATNGMLLPIAATFLVWIMNRKSLLGEHKNSPLQNAIAIAVLAVVIGLSGYKLAALI